MVFRYSVLVIGYFIYLGQHISTAQYNLSSVDNVLRYHHHLSNPSDVNPSRYSLTVRTNDSQASSNSSAQIPAFSQAPRGPWVPPSFTTKNPIPCLKQKRHQYSYFPSFQFSHEHARTVPIFFFSILSSTPCLAGVRRR